LYICIWDKTPTINNYEPKIKPHVYNDKEIFFDIFVDVAPSWGGCIFPMIYLLEFMTLPKIENQTVEFKSAFNEETIETLLAFSNAKDGTVYVSVSNKGIIQGITVQDLLSGNYTSRSCNKLIAKAFKEVGVIEWYGSGIMRVRQICREHRIKEPNYNEISNGFQVVLYNEKIFDSDDVTDVTENVTEIDVHRAEKILNLIKRTGPQKGGYWIVTKQIEN